MIKNDVELRTTLKRIEKLQLQVAEIRKTEKSPENYAALISGFVSEIDRMQLEVREFLLSSPTKSNEAA